jgi:hypothetical protein
LEKKLLTLILAGSGTTLRYGFQNPEVQPVVEVVHGPVEWLDGIGNLSHLRLRPLLRVIEAFFLVGIFAVRRGRLRRVHVRGLRFRGVRDQPNLKRFGLRVGRRNGLGTVGTAREKKGKRQRRNPQKF